MIEVADSILALQIPVEGYLRAGSAVRVAGALGHASVVEEIAEQAVAAGLGSPGAVLVFLAADAYAQVFIVADDVVLHTIGNLAKAVVVDAAVVASSVVAAMFAGMAVAVRAAAPFGHARARYAADLVWLAVLVLAAVLTGEIPAAQLSGGTVRVLTALLAGEIAA
jgi:hypothetical protein